MLLSKQLTSSQTVISMEQVFTGRREQITQKSEYLNPFSIAGKEVKNTHKKKTSKLYIIDRDECKI